MNQQVRPQKTNYFDPQVVPQIQYWHGSDFEGGENGREIVVATAINASANTCLSPLPIALLDVLLTGLSVLLPAVQRPIWSRVQG
jgi:hypothetical protein